MSALPSTPATPLALLRMTDGLVVHQALCAAATLGIADLLKDGASCTGQLAADAANGVADMRSIGRIEV